MAERNPAAAAHDRTTTREAVHETLIALGIDPDDHQATQRDMAFLRSWRESTETVKRQGIVTATGVIVVAFLGLLYWIVKGPAS